MRYAQLHLMALDWSLPSSLLSLFYSFFLHVHSRSHGYKIRSLLVVASASRRAIVPRNPPRLPRLTILIGCLVLLWQNLQCRVRLLGFQYFPRFVQIIVGFCQLYP